uniref:Uncharacterized protein n=1 Tax=Anopheles culicifacies TaxID=139723 RepID=A0A182MQ46_9DIPT
MLYNGDTGAGAESCAGAPRKALSADGTAYPVPIVLEDGATEMRLHELPPYITEHQVQAALAEYGEVLSVVEMVYGEKSKVPGVKTGIRFAKIIKKKLTIQTGPTITVAGEWTTVTYSGQNPYCRYCLMPEHAQKAASYAGVTKAAPTPTQAEPGIERASAHSVHAFKAPRVPSPTPSSSKPDPDAKGKHKNDDETVSDASNASILSWKLRAERAEKALSYSGANHEIATTPVIPPAGPSNRGRNQRTPEYDAEGQKRPKSDFTVQVTESQNVDSCNAP